MIEVEIVVMALVPVGDIRHMELRRDPALLTVYWMCRHTCTCLINAGASTSSGCQTWRLMCQ